MKDSRIGMRVELHPATDAWMRGDRYGDIVAISRPRHYIDPNDPRNGETFTVHMDKSGKRLRVTAYNLAQVFDANTRCPSCGNSYPYADTPLCPLCD